MSAHSEELKAAISWFLRLVYGPHAGTVPLGALDAMVERAEGNAGALDDIRDRLPPGGAATEATLEALRLLVDGTLSTADAATLAKVEALRVILAASLPATVGQKTKAASLPVTLASDEDSLARFGALNEAAPASDTASSGLNGRLQRIAQNISTLFGRFATAAALSDTAANPTSTTVGAGNLSFNGTQWERVYSNTAASGEASSAKTASGNSAAALANRSARGLTFFVNVSAVSGITPTLVVKLQEQDPVSLTWVDVPGAETASITGTGITRLTMYPGVSEAANSKVSMPLARVYRYAWVITGTTPSFTFSIGQQLIK